MNKIMVGLLGIALATAGGLAHGADGDQAAAGPGAVVPEPMGQQTRAWLELQGGGQAAGKPQPISNDVAGRVYKRYSDSFAHPIPAVRELNENWGSGSSR